LGGTGCEQQTDEHAYLPERDALAVTCVVVPKVVLDRLNSLGLHFSQVFQCHETPLRLNEVDDGYFDER
jgi:hypothetical protein